MGGVSVKRAMYSPTSEEYLNIQECLKTVHDLLFENLINDNYPKTYLSAVCFMLVNPCRKTYISTFEFSNPNCMVLINFISSTLVGYPTYLNISDSDSNLTLPPHPSPPPHPPPSLSSSYMLTPCEICDISQMTLTSPEYTLKLHLTSQTKGHLPRRVAGHL